jgi:cysteine desulfurase / selenocysteine lyase
MQKRALRQELFPITERLIYLNHAAVGPLSERACRAMEMHAREQRDFGALHWRDWLDEHRRFRELAARLIGSAASEISILKNTTEGLAFVAEGLDWKSGNNVVISALEFPSNRAPWMRLARKGVECRVIRAADGTFSAEDVAALIDDRTRLVSLSSVAFHNGFAPDLEVIGRVCRDRGVLFCVDAIQSLGALPLDVRKANISFLAADCHKWLMGPEGTAIFYCAAEVRDQLEVLEAGWMNLELGESWIEAAPTLLQDGRRFEGGSINTNGVYGAAAALELLEEIGIATVEGEVVRLARYLAERMESIGFEVMTPRPLRSGIVSVVPRGIDPARLRAVSGIDEAAQPDSMLTGIHQWLEREKIICTPREGALRFSPHFYNTEDEIDEVISALQELTG